MTLQQNLATLAERWGLNEGEADPETLAWRLVEQGEAAELAQLLEEAALTGSRAERALAREYGAALDDALRFDPLSEWQAEAVCNCGEEAQGEAFDGWDF